ncbi:MAG TPA: hypothetical protein VI911_04105 [Patescibacteria group bacterium]|nr:hypothetical protein [Patescibacteria group bacterium]
MSAPRTITEIVREGILLAATEPNTWTNADLAADLDVPEHIVSRARTSLSRGPAPKLEPGHNRRPGLVLTDLGLAWCRLQGWRIAP